ncbi:hypothetical protein BJX66DRAFT_320450 [Aspergillus keveii]|uniref:Uncharacterized protein n=1 Tax=Aspergillus keveii TaxID=714993 RepID=A0ABR4FH34_9EURO
MQPYIDLVASQPQHCATATVIGFPSENVPQISRTLARRKSAPWLNTAAACQRMDTPCQSSINGPSRGRSRGDG